MLSITRLYGKDIHIRLNGHDVKQTYTGKKPMGLTNKGDSICYAVAL